MAPIPAAGSWGYQRLEPHEQCEPWLIAVTPVVIHTAVPRLLQSIVNNSHQQALASSLIFPK